MWRDTPTVSELREAFPDVALSLETEFLANGLNGLGIKYALRASKKSVIFEVSLQDSFLLRFCPVDKGASGVAEWMTWNWHLSDGDSSEQVLTSSFRAFIELVDTSNQGKEVLASFTTHCEDMSELISNAVNGLRYRTGRSLKPISTRRRAG